MTNLIEQAVRQQLRFDFNGQISVEQLIKSTQEYMRKDKVDYDDPSDFRNLLLDYESRLEKEVESFGKFNRRRSTTKSILQQLAELKLNIVSSLIDEIDNNLQLKREKAKNEVRRAELLELKAQIQKEKDRAKTIQEIEDELAKLKV
jgi:hypothetical protein